MTSQLSTLISIIRKLVFYALVVVVTALVAIFYLQNQAEVVLDPLVFEAVELPLAIPVVGAFLIGVIGGVLLAFGRGAMLKTRQQLSNTFRKKPATGKDVRA